MRFVVSHISRKTSEMWGTHNYLQGQKCSLGGCYLIELVRRVVDGTAGVLFDYFGLRLEVVDHFLGVEDEVMSREQHGEAQPDLSR